MTEKQKPVAWMSPNKERLEFSRADTVYGSHTIPLYAHPAPDVVKQLVEALELMIEKHEHYGLPRDSALIAQAALAAAKEAGL